MFFIFVKLCYYNHLEINESYKSQRNGFTNRFQFFSLDWLSDRAEKYGFLIQKKGNKNFTRVYLAKKISASCNNDLLGIISTKI